MPKTTSLPRVFNKRALAALVECSPEGFFHRDQLAEPRLGVGDRAAAIESALADGLIGLYEGFIYDPERLTADQVRERSQIFEGALPALKHDGTPSVQPIRERLVLREQRLARLPNPDCERLLRAFEGTHGYLLLNQLCTKEGDEVALFQLLSANLLKQMDDVIFDPLKITRPTVESIFNRHLVDVLRGEVRTLLREQPGHTLQRADVVAKFGAKTVQKFVDSGDLVVFSIKLPVGESVWVRLGDADPDAAYQTAADAVLPKDEDWQAALDFCGETLRPGGHETPDSSRKEKVLARSYTLAAASRRLGIKSETLQNAIGARVLDSFVDPEGQTRLSAADVQRIHDDPARHLEIEDQEVISVRDIKIVLGEENAAFLRNQLRKIRKDDASRVRWGQVRDLLWAEPITLKQFREAYKTAKYSMAVTEEERREEERRKREEERQRERARREEERRQQEELRARLLAAFPTWQHAGRTDQQMILHVGPTNSGKTYNALEALAQAGTGWYLAPLRLLAFEVFDRLNRRGVFCNLLTGEERIDIPGATITAATIEMFSPNHSGECVVIDEAHMLADPDRGWAWTRALMESRAPEMHVIAPPFARPLIERLTTAAQIPLRVQEHQRLTPLEIATHPWPLENMPDKTILVAFSRRMVLRLKTELEKYQRRVSVVYGALPPEVRRKQADRFAEGQTEICVATDAVGMGLNLPADRVCFYELEKYDGRAVRSLTPNEALQIGGRAGRYGLSNVGVVGATTRGNLKLLRRLFEMPPHEPDRARVSPQLEDLELIPGNLAKRLARWRELQSIPEALRDVIEPADIDERIALAAMLSDAEVEKIGLAAAVQLVNAPTRESSRIYWHACAKAIIGERAMPIPAEPPMVIQDDHDLEATEEAIACADIYLWLSCRPEFADFAPEEAYMRALRAEWSMSIDAALLRRLDTAQRCINCRKKLPLNHRYALCDECYQASRYRWW